MPLKLNADLEARVAERTAELHASNEELMRQISERKLAEERAVWLASFPEQNPNPIVELDVARGVLHYTNPAALRVFPDLPEKGLQHPLFAGLGEVADTLSRGKIEAVRREVLAGEFLFAQTITYVREIGRLRIYTSDITDRKRAEEALRKSEAAERARRAELETLMDATSKLNERTLAMNEELILGSLRQHDLTEAAEKLNEQLRGEIAERKTAEAALQESEVQFHTMVDAISQLAWTARADGFIFWYNQRWFDYTGTTPEEMKGWGWQSVHDPEMLPGVVERWKASIATGEPFEMDFPLRAADGRFRWFLTRAIPIKDAAGQVVRWCGTNTDISKMRDAEMEIQRLNSDLEQRVIERTAQFEAANRELEAFSYSVSHDLRAPLRAIDGFSQAVLEDYGSQLPEEGRRYLRTIRVGAERMGTLIDDLLTFSRLSRTLLSKHEVDTGELVRSVLDDLKPQREGRQIELRIAELPACVGDPALLKQVWINLVSNAFKYTRKREPAVVEIGCGRTPEGDVFFVRDNGTGFDMRYAGKLFGVFQRLHRAEEYEGTGVGLALAQRIVHRHGGRIWADAALDRGATFHFTLEKGTQS